MKHFEIFALQSIKGLGDIAVANIVEYCHDNKIHDLVSCDIEALCQAPSLSRYKNILRQLDSTQLQNAVCTAKLAIFNWEQQGITLIPISSAAYPAQLRALADPPCLLFCKGNIQLLDNAKTATVIGSRSNTLLGEQICNTVVKGLIASGYVIISGLAMGIDAIAHKACIEENATGIAVLVDISNISPKTNKHLASQLLENKGLLIAENPPGISTRPAYFIKRDRIQAALSTVVYPIETAIDGGTMHCVNIALKLGKKVAVPLPSLSGYKDTNIKQIGGIVSLCSDCRVTKYNPNEGSFLS